MLGSMFAPSPPRGSCVDAQSTLPPGAGRLVRVCKRAKPPGAAFRPDLRHSLLPLAFYRSPVYHTLWIKLRRDHGCRMWELRRMPKIPLDFENAIPIIASIRAPVRLSAMRTVKPGPDAFGDRV